MPIINDAASLEAFKKRTYDSQSPEQLQQRISLQTTYWWLFGVTPGGKSMLLGPENTEAEVVRKGDDYNLAGPQDDAPYIYELPTRSTVSATRMVKADLMERGINADKALRRVRHR